MTQAMNDETAPAAPTDSIDAVALSNDIVERYRSYLQTTFRFRDPELRRQFNEAIVQQGEDANRTLADGPYLQGLPIYRPGATLRDVGAEIVGSALDEGFLAAVNGDRPLYEHQEQAIRQVAGGDNVVVATGTGSGKTESFLLPILLGLYQEMMRGTLDRPGVRALVLYPMNALAWDQCDRLGEIAQQLEHHGSPFRFTFGEYVGRTPEHEEDSWRNADERARHRRPCEQVFRQEMRDHPPHILLTNYSMLEYLLIRPLDSPLFDEGGGSSWRYMVLDEAHQYRGTRGEEMSMLVRRLKQRLVEGGAEQAMRCIATSATLAGGEQDGPAVADFAARLFDEPFDTRGVVTERVREVVSAESPISLAPEQYAAIASALDDRQTGVTRLRDMLERSGLGSCEAVDAEKLAGALLERDPVATRLRARLTREPVAVQPLSEWLFPDIENPAARLATLQHLVAVLMRATAPATGAPLLAARYHLFLRALEGAFVCLWPAPRIALERQVSTEEQAWFEVAVCRECGQHFLVGREEGGRLVEAIRDPSREDYAVDFYRPLIGTDGDVEAALTLCTVCGRIGRSGPNCGHDEKAYIQLAKESTANDQTLRPQRCGACDYTGGRAGAVREIIYGTDGPHAVVATSLHQGLPAERKKILAFADGRQEAAYFAAYLDATSRRFAERHLILTAARRCMAEAGDEGISPSDIAHELAGQMPDAGLAEPNASGVERTRRAWQAVLREFVTDERRIALDGVGLVRWQVDPRSLPSPECLTRSPWSLTPGEAEALMQCLLDLVRQAAAVNLESAGTERISWSDLELGRPNPMQMRIGRPQGRRQNVTAFDGDRGRWANFLTGVLGRSGMDAEAVRDTVARTLRELWDLWTSRSEPPLLVPSRDGRQLNVGWWRLVVLDEKATLFQCGVCGRLTPWSVRGVCPHYRCAGELWLVRRGDLEPDHYRNLYQRAPGQALRVEEHTAQLSHSLATEHQRRFRDNKLDLLSCSTTFELGVDLGDLDTVFLRNVPPEPFNYAQRVGRAGRRAGRPGFAVTYCQRRPHDLYHFADPKRMIIGKTRPPVVSAGNDRIATRHVAAVALSAYFRARPERFSGKVAGMLERFDAPTLVADLEEFLRENQPSIEASLARIVPADMHERVGLHDASWAHRLTAPDGRLSEAALEAASEHRRLGDLEKEAGTNRQYRRAEWARKRARTIEREDVLSFLSRHVVIPKYGFPVDVVSLDTSPSSDAGQQPAVDLQRDLSLAIAEFAPGAQIVAHKRIWTSAALKRVPEREWRRRRYARCVRHSCLVHTSEESPGTDGPQLPCGCPPRWRSFVEPSFGFETELSRPEPAVRRPPKLFSTRPFFAGFEDHADEPREIELGPLRLRAAAPGRLISLCEGPQGRGFYVCRVCGRGAPNPGDLFDGHKTALGRTCRGTAEQVSLGHEMLTDVVRLRALTHGDVDDPTALAHGVGWALLEGLAEILEVPGTDLGVALEPAEAAAGLPSIILYDNVPGGARLVGQLEKVEVLIACLEAACYRVSGPCGCDEQASCYGCLRNYRNQFIHDDLRRGPVHDFLLPLLEIGRRPATGNERAR